MVHRSNYEKTTTITITSLGSKPLTTTMISPFDASPFWIQDPIPPFPWGWCTHANMEWTRNYCWNPSETNDERWWSWCKRVFPLKFFFIFLELEEEEETTYLIVCVDNNDFQNMEEKIISLFYINYYNFLRN